VEYRVCRVKDSIEPEALRAGRRGGLVGGWVSGRMGFEFARGERE
jgi:hypothetical protein